MTEQKPHTEIKETVNLWYAYQTIQELPVLRWFEILKTGHLHYLYKLGTGPTREILGEIWLNIQQQYFDEFGIEDSFRIRLEKMKKLTELYCDVILTGDRSLVNHINQIEFELKQNGEEIVISQYKIKVQLEKHMKFHIPMETISVIEWGHMVRDYEAEHRRMNSENLKQKIRTRG